MKVQADRNRRLVWLVLLAAAALALAGCDDARVVRHGPGSPENNGTNNGANNNDSGQPTENGTDDAGHGPDEDQELIEAGLITGSWRVGTADNNDLVVNLDLVHEAESTTVEGYYTMGGGIYDRLDGVSGEVSSESSFDGETLTIKWNPTDVASEMYTITAQKQDRDTFTGRLTALEYEQLDKEVVINRYHFAGGGSAGEGDDGTSAGDIDAGPQGGAGSGAADAGM